MLKPYLATDADLKFIRYPVLVQPKVDGVRGIYLPSLGLTGRSLKQFKNRQLTDKLSHLDLEGLDGELCYTDNVTTSDLCRTTMSLVNTLDGRSTAFWFLFDYITKATIGLHYQTRYKILVDKVWKLHKSSTVWSQTLRVMPCKEIYSEQDLLKLLQDYLSTGYEGIIIRDPKGLHKSGRCTQKEAAFVRIKDFATEEAEIIQLLEAEENLNAPLKNELGYTARSSHKANKQGKGMLGAFICHSPRWGNFRVSAGKMSHQDRIYFWENPTLILGKTCTYKYLQTGSLNAPRMATFQHFRIDEDIV